MIPSYVWAEKKFNEFNNAIFKGRLLKPVINITDFCFCDGEFCYGSYEYALKTNWLGKITGVQNAGTITLNKSYDLTERRWEGVLLHEMVHMYVYTVLLKNPKDPHGPEFMNIANKIQAQGWNVLDETYINPKPLIS